VRINALYLLKDFFLLLENISHLSYLIQILQITFLKGKLQFLAHDIPTSFLVGLEHKQENPDFDPSGCIYSFNKLVNSPTRQS